MTYFWTLCLMPSPHNLPFLHSNPFFQPSLPIPLNFFFYFILAFSDHQLSFSRGQVRGHLAHPRRRVWATWQQRPLLFEICRTVSKLSPSPPPLRPLCEENPCRDASMGGCEAAKFRCCHEEESHSSARKRWEIKEATHLCSRSWTKTLRDDAAILMVTISQHHQRTMSSLVWLSGYIFQMCPAEAWAAYFIVFQNRFSID